MEPNLTRTPSERVDPRGTDKDSKDVHVEMQTAGTCSCLKSGNLTKNNSTKNNLTENKLLTKFVESVDQMESPSWRSILASKENTGHYDREGLEDCLLHLVRNSLKITKQRPINL